MTDVQRLVEARQILASTSELTERVRRRLHVVVLVPIVWTHCRAEDARRALVLTATGLGGRVSND